MHICCPRPDYLAPECLVRLASKKERAGGGPPAQSFFGDVRQISPPPIMHVVSLDPVESAWVRQIFT